MPSHAHALSEIVVATANPHKVAELNAMLTSGGVSFISITQALQSMGGIEANEPIEDGSTFEANSGIKARSYAQQTGRPCLADDSGLMVDALDGAPGVISSHYATGGVETGLSRDERDAANNEKLLAELVGVPEPERTARFVCVMTLALPALGGGAEILARTRGTFEGRIGLPATDAGESSAAVPRGSNGFGYDPLFLVAPEFRQTGAELEPGIKNTISHRARAASAMLQRIEALRS